MLKKVVLDKADRLYHFPLDLEDFFPKRIAGTGIKKGRLIDLGHFTWPVAEPTDQVDQESLKQASPDDMMALKESISAWLKKEYTLKFDPKKEIYIGAGIRRIICDICLAYVESDDIVLCPEPGVPFYKRLVITAGGLPVTYKMSDRTAFKPSFKQLSSKLGKAAKILILNNPHNPFGSVLDESDFSELLRIASRENLFVVSDAAYSSLSEEKYIPLMSIRGSRKAGLEVFSIPYVSGLPYHPLGFAIGAPEIIGGLKIIAKSIGGYLPKLWIEQACRALEEFPSPELNKTRKNINQSRVEAKRMADKLKWKYIGDNSSPFLWIRIPGRLQSAEFASDYLRRKNILMLPGKAFGESGEGFIRLALTVPPDDYREAGERMIKVTRFRRKGRE
jgi:LL-diaminopimelate aminotransferase